MSIEYLLVTYLDLNVDVPIAAADFATKGCPQSD